LPEASQERSKVLTTITVGLLGAGRGLSLAQLFDRVPGYRVVAVCDAIPERLDRARSACPLAEGFGDYAAMLREPFDVMIVASAPPSHADHVCAALEAGKAVLSEVPAAHTLDDAQRIVDTVARTSGYYMLGENCNYYGFIHAWKKLLEEGVLGEVIHTEGEYVHDIRGITWVDADGRYYNPADPRCPATARPSWRARYNPIQYITHSLGPLLWLTSDRCTSVSCLSTGCRTQPEIGSPDGQIALFETNNGAPIRQSCIFSAPKEPGGQWYSLYCSRGYAESKRAPWDSGKLYLADGTMQEIQRKEWPAAVETPLASSGHGGIDGGLVWDFAHAFRRGAPSPIDVHTAMDYTLPGIYAALSAERNGERVRIPDTRTERLVTRS